jgi:hypothetical protein
LYVFSHFTAASRSFGGQRRSALNCSFSGISRSFLATSLTDGLLRREPVPRAVERYVARPTPSR